MVIKFLSKTVKINFHIFCCNSNINLNFKKIKFVILKFNIKSFCHQISLSKKSKQNTDDSY